MKVLLLLSAVMLVGCTGKYVRPTSNAKVAATPEALARGSYLVNSVTQCPVCHTPRVDNWLGGERTDAYLAGGSVFDDREMGFRIAAPNITPDNETGIGRWSDDELIRAIRDGVSKDGELMWPPMPFSSYALMSDEDVRAIVAYLRTVPPVKSKVEREKVLDVPFMFKIVHGMGVMHHRPVKDVKAPPEADKKTYGRYLSKVGVCWDCHSLTKMGPSDDHMMAGSKIPLSEPEYGKVSARNLTSDPETGLGKYSADQIKQALKIGRRLDGKPMAPPMSLLIPHLSTWTEEDLDALVTFIKTLPPVKHKVPEPELTAEAKKLVRE